MTDKREIKHQGVKFYERGTYEAKESKHANKLTKSEKSEIVSVLVEEWERLKRTDSKQFYDEMNEYSGFNEGFTLSEHRPNDDNFRVVRNKLSFEFVMAYYDSLVNFFMVGYLSNGKAQYEARVSTDTGREVLSSKAIKTEKDIIDFVDASTEYAGAMKLKG
ncbi:hypothetical protein [Lactococcus allomyrinae]|uniref:Uncharacterized protein n=1 Tax=Lactococcus allomyrinae TaxID=2419773 RepID=A0A387BC08_9LACT|nr:hypothetical protein [Lactococcus allomyrinae]AYF99873.1 hypothetical protein D7I46_01500 [Lactococcus allomyrinae]